MSEWEVPGHDLLELLGFGTTGEVWRARERSSGALVVLRRLAGGDRAAVAAVRRQATVVRSLPTPHVVRLRTATRAGRDDALVLDHAAGGSLAALVSRRGVLPPGEVVTVLAPLAEALGQAHEHGLVHGRLGASSVLLTAHGMPLLDGLGLEALHDPEDGLDPTGALGATADVWALGALGHRLLTGEEPGRTPLAELAPTAPVPLVRAIESALEFDPAARPSAGDLAAALLAACPALPLAGVQAVAEPDPPSRVRQVPARVPPRRVVLGAAAALALAAVVALGWTWGARSAPATASVQQAPAAGTDWATVLRGLDAARAAAFAAADPAGLAEVYAPGSPLLAADRASVTALARAHRSAAGVVHEVVQVALLRQTADRAVLRVREALAAHDVLDATGAVQAHTAAGPVVVHEVTLARSPAGWRVHTVVASP